MRHESDPLVELHGWLCAIDRGYYSNDRVGLQLIDAMTCEPIAKITVNLEPAPPKGCVWVKDYAENDGVLAACIKAGVVEETVMAMHIDGRTVITAHKLLLKEIT